MLTRRSSFAHDRKSCMSLVPSSNLAGKSFSRKNRISPLSGWNAPRGISDFSQLSWYQQLTYCQPSGHRLSCPTWVTSKHQVRYWRILSRVFPFFSWLIIIFMRMKGYPACRGSVHITSGDVYAPLDFDTGFMTEYVQPSSLLLICHTQNSNVVGCLISRFCGGPTSAVVR